MAWFEGVADRRGAQGSTRVHRMCAQTHGDVPAILSQLGVGANRLGSLAAGRGAVGNNERSVEGVLDALGGEDALGPGEEGVGVSHLDETNLACASVWGRIAITLGAIPRELPAATSLPSSCRALPLARWR
jgi:hypothetical protein